MVKDYPGESWKNVDIDFEYSSGYRLEVSNFGRLKTFSSFADGHLINGSHVNGYKIIRMTLRTPRPPKEQAVLDKLRKEVATITKDIKNATNNKVINELTLSLEDLKKVLAKKVKADDKKRNVYYQALVHRLVAKYFLKPAKPDQVIVTHLDYNKINNRASNLKWMTLEENYKHQQSSPQLIAERNDWTLRTRVGPTTKLTVTKVMLLKKLLNENKPIKQLAKQFRVTDTQIIRIKKGENWGYVEAAK